MKKILFTGFDPFGGEEINPSWEAVKLLPDMINEAEIIKLQLPTVFYDSIEIIKNEINKKKPDIVLSVGQAGGRACINLEKVAINLIDTQTPDNKGKAYHQSIIDGAEAMLFSSLPLENMVSALNSEGFPAQISESAGRYVCNHLLYGVLHHIKSENLPIKAGFIHIPMIPLQTIKKPSIPTMPLDCIVKALIILTEEIIRKQGEKK